MRSLYRQVEYHITIVFSKQFSVFKNFISSNADVLFGYFPKNFLLNLSKKKHKGYDLLNIVYLAF